MDKPPNTNRGNREQFGWSMTKKKVTPTPTNNCGLLIRYGLSGDMGWVVVGWWSGAGIQGGHMINGGG